MPPSKSSSTKKSPAKKGPDNVMAIVGTDDGRVKQEAKELAAKWTPEEAGEFGCEIVDGQVDNTDQAVSQVHQVMASLETLPFFGEKLVWFKSVNFMGDTVAGRSNAVQDALADLGALLERGVDPRVRFLLSATPVDKRRAFYKGLSKWAQVQLFDAITPGSRGWEEQAVAFIEERAREKGLRFDPDAMEHFLTCTAGDTRLIDSELEKLSLSVEADGRVDRELATQMVARTQAGVIFELSNAFSERDLPRALRLVDQLLFHGESPIGILLAAVIPTVRNLLAVRILISEYKLGRISHPGAFMSAAKRLPDEALAFLPKKKDGTVNLYGLGFVAANAGKFTVEELRHALKVCLEANLRLVSSQLDPKSVLDHALVQCLA